MRGVPTIIVIKGGCFIGLEVKGPLGTLSGHQVEFCDGVREAGGEYYVVKAIEDVQRLGL